MPTPEKEAVVDELKREFESAPAIVLTGYIGLSVAQLQNLRRSLGSTAKFRVSKNTLTKIALREAGLAEELEDLVQGPSAFTFVRGDPVQVAKGLRDFARSHSALEIRGGILDGKRMSAEDVHRIADLQSREALLGRAAGAMKAPLAKAAALLNAPMTKAVRTADALREKREREGGGGDTATATSSTAVPAAEPAAEPTPAESAEPS